MASADGKYKLCIRRENCLSRQGQPVEEPIAICSKSHTQIVCKSIGWKSQGAGGLEPPLPPRKLIADTQNKHTQTLVVMFE